MVDEAEANSTEAPADEEAGPTAPDSPGRCLRQAREARKLETSYVATALRLAPQVVEAIERDDYASLPSAVFVSGYIRSYARLLGLDPAPLNERFHALHPDAEAPPRHVARQESTLGEENGTGHVIASLVAILIVIALAAGAYGWWVTRPASDQAPESAADATADPSAEQSSSLAPRSSTLSRSLTPVPASKPSSELTEAGSTEAPARAAAVDGATRDPVLRASSDVEVIEGNEERPANQRLAADQTPAPLPTPASLEDEPPTASRSASDAALDGEAEAAAETEEAQAAGDPEGLAPVQLAFSGPCWVDIRDSSGTVLLFGEMGSGDREIIEGTPPYSLVLGNAAAVELTVGGEPFDLRSIARGNVARFELDPAEISARSAAATD